MMIDLTTKQYQRDFCAVFGRTAYKWGQFQNMHNAYPYEANGIAVKSSESLYQALRFQEYSDIQHQILEAETPFAAKHIAHENEHLTVAGWHDNGSALPLKVFAMLWAIELKAQWYFDTFNPLFKEAEKLSIVEYSRRDLFWGAAPHELTNQILVGQNVLGKLWDIVKEKANTLQSDFHADPMDEIRDFCLLGEKIK